MVETDREGGGMSQSSGRIEGKKLYKSTQSGRKRDNHRTGDLDGHVERRLE